MNNEKNIFKRRNNNNNINKNPSNNQKTQPKTKTEKARFAVFNKNLK